MVKQSNPLDLDRCPHCNIAKPNLNSCANWQTTSALTGVVRFWMVYGCASCGGTLLTAASAQGGEISEMYPGHQEVDNAIPDRAKEYLAQAISSLHAPVGAIMLAASSIDSMLKHKGYTEGNLYPRIEKAAKDHLITEEMAAWAHDVRLDANDQRHADESEPLPTADDASKCIEFAQALAEFLFVLPKRVERGREKNA